MLPGTERAASVNIPRACISTFCLLLALAPPLTAVAQAPPGVFRIGILWSTPGSVPHLQEAFLKGMRDLGYVEGQNFFTVSRYASGGVSGLDDVAAELVRLRVDIIVAMSMPVIQAVQRATRTIPIVMAVSGDAVEFGHVTSLARPGGNVTGLSALGPEVNAKQMELLREVVPEATRFQDS